jgi:putative heme transporter
MRRIGFSNRRLPALRTARSAPVVPSGPPVVPALTVPAVVRDPASEVPYPLRVAAALSWRLLVVAGAVAVFAYLIIQLSTVVIPVAVALLLSALLVPAVDALCRRGVPRGLSAAVVLVAGIAVVGGVLTFVVRAFIAGLPDLQDQIGRSLTAIRDWLVNGPFKMSKSELDTVVDGLTRAVTENRQQITSGALSTVTGVGHFVTGALLVLFTLIFFLYDGRRIWHFLVRGVPRQHRNRVHVAGERGFASLVGYVRASVLVAVVDAVGIGVGLWAFRVPLVVPLAALVFLGAFIPIIGAVIAGTIAVLVALVTKGLITALCMLAIVIAVQQIEGHVLQPVLMGRAVALHPLAVVLAVAGGVVVAGIVGALLAVPLVAVLNAGTRSLLSVQDHTVQPVSVDAENPMDASPPGEGPQERPAVGEDLDDDVDEQPDGGADQPAGFEDGVDVGVDGGVDVDGGVAGGVDVDGGVDGGTEGRDGGADRGADRGADPWR